MAKLKAHVPDPELWEYHRKVSEDGMKTRRVAAKLETWPDRGATAPKFIQVPLPIPVGNKATACLFLRVFAHFRGPGWKPFKRFQLGFVPPDVLARCRRHILGLIEAHRHAPALGQEWTAHLRRALDALQEDPRIEAARQRNVEQFGDW